MSCEYYPCHDLENMSCSWCYCPFYFYCSRLNEENLKWLQEEVGIGGYWLDRYEAGMDPVFACEKCTLLHRPEVAQFVTAKMVDVVAQTFARFRKDGERNSEET